MSVNRFSWRFYDLNSILPDGWQNDILNVSKKAVPKILRPRSVTSKEGNPNLKILTHTVNGENVRKELP